MINPHNATKIKSLYYLQLRKMGKYPQARALKIARATGVKRTSLYVLLTRWDKWRLVNKLLTSKYYEYEINPPGERYLENLSKWYGDYSELVKGIAEKANTVFYWKSTIGHGGNPKIYAIYPPYQGEDDIKTFDIHAGVPRSSDVMIECKNAFDAVETKSKALGIQIGHDLLEYLVNLKIGLRWSQNDNQAGSV